MESTSYIGDFKTGTLRTIWSHIGDFKIGTPQTIIMES